MFLVVKMFWIQYNMYIRKKSVLLLFNRLKNKEKYTNIFLSNKYPIKKYLFEEIFFVLIQCKKII